MSGRGRMLRINAMLAAALFLSFACSLSLASEEHANGDDSEEEAGHGGFTVEELTKHGVEVDTAGPGEVDVGIELPGEVRPNAERLVHAAPLFPGLVREVRKRVGDSVRAGDVLATIQSENLSTYELRAALDGTVLDAHITPGEVVGPEDAAFILADLTTVWVDIDVYQKALDQVRLGQPVRIEATQSETAATGAVSYITPIVDQATRTATARVVLPNQDGSWRPGLFVTATIFQPVRADVVVPRRALRSFEGSTVLFVVEGDHFVPRPVTVGRVGRTKAEVTTGVKAGERFADDGAFLVKAELGKGEAAHAH